MIERTPDLGRMSGESFEFWMNKTLFTSPDWELGGENRNAIVLRRDYALRNENGDLVRYILLRASFPRYQTKLNMALTFGGQSRLVRRYCLEDFLHEEVITNYERAMERFFGENPSIVL